MTGERLHAVGVAHVEECGALLHSGASDITDLRARRPAIIRACVSAERADESVLQGHIIHPRDTEAVEVL